MTMPVLFLQGRLDPGQRPEDFFRVEEAIADGTLQFVEAGHYPHLEAPEKVNEAVLAFLACATSRAAGEMGSSQAGVER
jgi:pimeloyl-ACP methyl ester carboxylesterase